MFSLGIPLETKATPIATIGKIKAIKGKEIKEGLITAINPSQGIGAKHVVEGAERATIKIEGKEHKLVSVKGIRDTNTLDAISSLYGDACLIEWEPPISITTMPKFPRVSHRHPDPDELVYIPRNTNAGIQWETRYIMGTEDYATWANLPRRIYSAILWLNGRPINKGTPFNLGDSGGGWISRGGELLAVTSRVTTSKFGPNKQVVYGTLLSVNPSPEKRGDRKYPAILPLFGSVLLLVAINFLAKMKRNNKMKT
jgi:hypothetical protein